MGVQSLTEDGPGPGLAEALSELGHLLVGSVALEPLLERVALLAKQSVPGAEEVSLTLVRGGIAETAATTGERATAVDRVQYGVGGGPCLDAAQGQELVHVSDLAAEDRWPEAMTAARGQGFGALLVAPLPVQEDLVGALNVYGAAAFSAEAVRLAEVFAGQAAVAVANTHQFAEATALAQQLQEAMASRAVIEQAKGVLMGQQRCTSGEAFDILVRASQQRNVKLREVAQRIVEAVEASAEPLVDG